MLLPLNMAGVKLLDVKLVLGLNNTYDIDTITCDE